MHEIALDLPRFASLVPCCSADRCQSQCTLPLRGFVYEVQIAQWLEREFLSPVPRLDAQHMVRMRDIRDDTPVVICLLANTIVIETPSMELAGDLVQSMLQSLGVTDLGCVANFPTVVAAAQDAMSAISDYSDVGQRLSGAMGGHTALAKGLLYQAEDARVLRVLGVYDGYVLGSMQFLEGYSPSRQQRCCVFAVGFCVLFFRRWCAERRSFFGGKCTGMHN